MDRAGRPHRATRPDWSPAEADAAARAAGIGPLGDRHWKILATCREEAARSGRAPGLARIEALTGVDDAELHVLFPGDAASLITRIAGVTPAAGSRRGAGGSGQAREES